MFAVNLSMKNLCSTKGQALTERFCNKELPFLTQRPRHRTRSLRCQAFNTSRRNALVSLNGAALADINLELDPTTILNAILGEGSLKCQPNQTISPGDTALWHHNRAKFLSLPGAFGLPKLKQSSRVRKYEDNDNGIYLDYPAAWVKCGSQHQKP